MSDPREQLTEDEVDLTVVEAGDDLEGPPPAPEEADAGQFGGEADADQFAGVANADQFDRDANAEESGVAAEAATATAGGADEGAASVEQLIDQLETVVAERDEYLALARARQAEFENFRKQMLRRQTEHFEQASAGLVEKLLVVLDAFDSGVAHGLEGLAPLQGQLLSVLEKEGLEQVDPTGEPFDPTLHEAVLHEPDGNGGGPVVAEVMRKGYRFKGRVLRPAMVKVKG